MDVRRSPRKHHLGQSSSPQSKRAPMAVIKGNGQLRAHISFGKPIKNGRLKGKITSMPLDVVYEILRSLAPQDLLNLAQTCKQFHATLHRKESKFIWKNSLEARGVPQCPSDLSEIRYARFIFGNICDYCFKRFKKASLKFIWLSRKKVCWYCAHGEQFSRHAPRCISRSNVPLCFAPEVQYSYYGRPCVPKKDYDLLRQEYESKNSDLERDSWFCFKEDEYAKLMELQDLIEEWMRQALQKQRDELRPAKKTWWDSVVERIRQYDKSLENEIEYMDYDMDFSFYSVIGRAGTGKITDRAWNKIKRKSIRCLQRSRSNRIAEILPDRLDELEVAFDNFIDEESLDPDRLPRCADLVIQPEVLALLEANPNDHANDDEFRAVLDESFPLLMERWRSNVENSLLAVMQNYQPSATLEDLHAPSTLRCSCDEVVRYEAAFQHPCTTEPRYNDRLSALTSTYIDQAPWSSASLRLVPNPPTALVQVKQESQ